MSLSESIDPYSPEQPKESPLIPPTPDEPSVPPFVEEFHTILKQYMDVEEHAPVQTRFGSGTAFRGKLHGRADDLYDILAASAHAEHYTVYMQRNGDLDEVVLVDGVLVARNITAPWWVHLLLLLVTIVTTTFAGSLLAGYDFASIRTAIDTQDRLLLLEIYREGRRFAFPLLLILGVHEMGHYVAARLHGIRVTLPFFIPLPLFGTLGTLGAIIFIKDTFRNRRVLFDVGIAGPLAGLVVAVVVFAWGLQQPESGGLPLEWLQAGINRVSVPPLLDSIATATTDIQNTDSLDRIIFYRHPEALAGWFGIVLTTLNLLPLGQFDGGHIAFALFGRRVAWPLAGLTAISLVLLGLTGWIGWLIWPVLAFFTGLLHPPPHDDITPLGWPRIIIGLATFVLFFMMIMMTPFYNSRL
jgi:membrane-associated protease RseP (regulator of RpoE activity)